MQSCIAVQEADIDVVQGSANAELYEGLLMLQHRGQDSAGMVTTDWDRFCEHRANGLVREVWPSQSRMDKLRGEPRAPPPPPGLLFLETLVLLMSMSALFSFSSFSHSSFVLLS